MDPIQATLRTGMTRAIREVLEGMTFMPVEELPSEDSELDQEGLHCVSLLVHEPVQWEFKLFMPRNLLEEMGEAVYAEPRETLTESSLHDLLSEILNTAAGRFLSEVLVDHQEFSLGLPESCDFDSAIADAPLMQWHFEAGEKTFAVTLLGTLTDNLTDLVRSDTK
ncbi:MAG: hypothetical protein SCI25_10265 [Desulfuromonadales bacterium]|nr:hypothetical protein [Desulfuromonadales bacterium]MDW7757675.1 hypothetical protein [Desulfuromonadales bacterium]